MKLAFKSTRATYIAAVVVVAVASVLAVNYFILAWTAPTADPPAGGIVTATPPPPIWIEDGSGNIYYEGGNVGIGTNNPQVALDIPGTLNVNAITTNNTIKVGNDTGMKGTIRWDDTSGELQVATDDAGSTWESLMGGSGASETGEYLVGNVHTVQACIDAEGTVDDVSEPGVKFCRLSGTCASHGSGWSQYNSWCRTTTKTNTCPYEIQQGGSDGYSCVPETCECIASGKGWSNSLGTPCSKLCSGGIYCISYCTASGYGARAESGCF